MNSYTADMALSRIEDLRVKKRVSISQMLKDSNLSKSVMDNLKKGSMFSADKAAMLADYLECSVDYLLGRTDEPKICTSNSVKTGDINGNNSGNFTFGTFAQEKQKDSIKQEFLIAFDNLDFVDKMEIMNAVLEKTKMKGNE